MIKQAADWVKGHKYCYALTYFIFYFICFFSLNASTSVKYWIHCPIDDMIPFVEGFVVPYFLWYLVMPGGLLYLMLVSKSEFLKLCAVMFGGMTISLLIYWILPNGLNLRVEIPNDRILCRMMNMIYSIDRPANVCPSIHVSSSAAVAVAIAKAESLKTHPLIRGTVVFLCVLICISTVFVRQHSVIDVVCGILLTAVLAAVVYRNDRKKKL